MLEFLDRTRVSLSRFDDSGWEIGGRTWSEEYWQRERGVTLADFIGTTLALPPAEAADLAAEIEGPWLAEYEARGGLTGQRQIDRIAKVIFASLGALLVLALIGVAVLVWLIAR